ncbi:nitrous oxide reductase accessory protein NosL [Natronolimnohabitans sp. A-GB9]|uniref:nitrous oxide reductase accessory protein NosL n=1 Tax=Natronolimnohabitans sp. A-GB9 TaxID=3069757 RepID=UPI0027B2953B|nr:nitrous oxide reductase accessory protein NosL [Natronolimnohabitans sp. A-GB9]MDQ2050068.1 nitrous oxide reductase accessory protein NosL [Natronolimnohabitans sp. A-GB9]
MDRRKFLLGSTAAGAGLLFGSGAFSAAGVGHDVSIETGNGYLHVEPNPDYEGNAVSYVDDSDDPLELTIDDLAEHGWVRFDDLLLLTNTGTQPVSVYVEDQDWLGDDTDAVLDYRLEDRSIVGEENAVELDGVGGEGNSVTITIRADATDHDDLEHALPEPEDGEDHTVMFVAEIVSNVADGESIGLDLEATETITPREIAEVTATVYNRDNTPRSGIVALDLEEHVHPGEGLDLDLEADVGNVPEIDLTGEDGDVAYSYLDRGDYPQGLRSSEVTVDAVERETVSFEIPVAYRNLEIGDLQLDENRLEITAEFGEETVTEEETVIIEDSTTEWFQPDNGKQCPVCNMATEMYNGWHAMVTHGDGSRIEFCSIGCAVAYWVYPVHFAEEVSDRSTTYYGIHPGTDSEDLVTMWAPDFTDMDPSDGLSWGDDPHPGYKRFIDMREGYFVLDDETATKYWTPMGGGSPVCFAAYDDALAYVDGSLETLPDDVDVSNVTEDDIVTLDDFDHDIATTYRGRFVP